MYPSRATDLLSSDQKGDDEFFVCLQIVLLSSRSKRADTYARPEHFGTMLTHACVSHTYARPSHIRKSLTHYVRLSHIMCVSHTCVRLSEIHASLTQTRIFHTYVSLARACALYKDHPITIQTRMKEEGRICSFLHGTPDLVSYLLVHGSP